MVTGKQVGAALLLVATFAVGAAAGRASTAWSHRGGDSRPERSDRARGRNGGFLTTLDRELSLTPTQRDSIQTILRKWDPAMRAVWDGMRPTFDSLRAQVRADIMRVLTDNQKAAFQRWSARADSAARKRSKEEQGAR